MKKLVILAALAGGIWWYATHVFNFADTLAYAKKNKGASWAPGIEYAVGMVYYQRGDNPKAQEAFTQLLTDFPTGQYTARALLRLSETAESNREYQAERDALDRFIAEFPSHPDLQMAVKRRELIQSR